MLFTCLPVLEFSMSVQAYGAGSQLQQLEPAEGQKELARRAQAWGRRCSAVKSTM